MSEREGRDRQAVLPQLRYEDPAAAVAWLCRAFGFTAASRLAGPDGTLHLADLRTPGGDLAGRLWNFSQHLRHAAPGDWGAEPAS